MVDDNQSEDAAQERRREAELWRKSLFLVAMAFERSHNLGRGRLTTNDCSDAQELVHETIFDLLKKEQDHSAVTDMGKLELLFADQMKKTRNRIMSSRKRKRVKEESFDESIHQAKYGCDDPVLESV